MVLKKSFFPEGSLEWHHQRIAAILIFPFLFSLTIFPGFFDISFLSWSSWIKFLVFFFLFYIFQHFTIGIHEIVQDYLHGQAIKASALLLCDVFILQAFCFAFFLFFN